MPSIYASVHLTLNFYTVKIISHIFFSFGICEGLHPTEVPCEYEPYRQYSNSYDSKKQVCEDCCMCYYIINKYTKVINKLHEIGMENAYFLKNYSFNFD